MISHFQQWTDHSDRKSVRKCRPLLLLFSRSVMSDSFNPMDCSTSVSLVLHYLRSLLKLTSTESMRPYNHFILCHPLLLLPSIFPSIRGFSKNDNITCNAAYFKILILYWQEVELRRNQALVNKIHNHGNC